jgi:hypothetical protein
MTMRDEFHRSLNVSNASVNNDDDDDDDNDHDDDELGDANCERDERRNAINDDNVFFRKISLAE